MSNRKKPNFNLTFKDFSKQETLCLLSLSDAWMRSASFDKPDLASDFNLYTKKLCESSKGQAVKKNKNRTLNRAMSAFQNIVDLAEDEGIDRVILPICSNSDSGKFIKKYILNEYDGDIRIELQTRAYVSGLDHIGKIDNRRRTAFSYGMAKVKPV